MIAIGQVTWSPLLPGHPEMTTVLITQCLQSDSPTRSARTILPNQLHADSREAARPFSGPSHQRDGMVGRLRPNRADRRHTAPTCAGSGAVQASRGRRRSSAIICSTSSYTGLKKQNDLSVRPHRLARRSPPACISADTCAPGAKQRQSRYVINDLAQSEARSSLGGLPRSRRYR